MFPYVVIKPAISISFVLTPVISYGITSCGSVVLRLFVTDIVNVLPSFALVLFCVSVYDGASNLSLLPG